MRRTIFCVSTLIGLLSFAFSCRELHAIDVLDQINVVAPGTTSIGALVVDDRFAPGQTVRAGLSGLLSRIELGVYRSSDVASPMFVDIVRTQSGKPSFAAADRLATRTLTQDQIPLRTTFAQTNAPGFTVSVDFLASNLAFNNGDTFGIVLRSNAAQSFAYSWWVSGDTINTYPAGASFSFQYSSNAVLSQGARDVQFATYVAVPEPSAVLLTATAFGSLFLRRCKSLRHNRA